MNSLLFIYAIILVAVLAALIFVFWGDIIGERKFKVRRGLRGMSKSSFHLTPDVLIYWNTIDIPTVNFRAFQIECAFSWGPFGGWIGIEIKTPRPWDESAMWKGREKELAHAKEQLRLQNEAIRKADEKNARKATEKAMSKIGRELAALRPNHVEPSKPWPRS